MPTPLWRWRTGRAYGRTSLTLTTNLPFEEWTEIMGSERLTGALLDRLTHRVHILEANGPGYRLGEAKRRLKKTAAEASQSARPPRQAAGEDGTDGTDGQG